MADAAEVSRPVVRITGDNNAATNYDSNNAQTNYVSMELGNQRGNENGREGSDDDLASISQSIESSVLTADGIHDYPGFLCVCIVILIGDMSRGVMFPSMWPLIETLGGSQVTLGFAVASFSFGRVLVNPIFGKWSHEIGYTKTLLLSSSVLLIGTLLYAQVQNVGRIEFLILAQTVLGIGSGTLGVTRAFVADVTARRNRTTYMAWITAVQYGGFTVTPAFGALFNKVLGDREWFALGGMLRLNMFTAPAHFMTCVVSCTILILYVFFQNRQRIATEKPKAKMSTRRQAIEDVANKITFTGLTVYDCCIMGCMILNVSTKGSIASFETLGIAIADDYFSMDASRSGITIATCGLMGVVCLLNMGRLEKKFNDVQIITFGMLIMAGGILNLSFLDNEADNPHWTYTLSMFLIYSIGYPIGHTAVLGLFSKIVGRRPQGTLLGWFASAGSIARMFFPVMSGCVANYSSVATLFLILTTVLAVSTIFVSSARGTLNLLSS